MKIFVLFLMLISQNLALDSATRMPNPSLRDSAKQNCGKPPCDFALFSQGGLPRSHLLARNDEILDSSLRLRFAQNDKIGAENDNFGVRVAESRADSAKSQNLIKNNRAKRNLLKASSGVGEGVVREGEGSDFAIQAPTPSLKENARDEKWDSKADLSAQRRGEIDSADSQNLRGNPQGFARAVARSNHPPIEKSTELQSRLPRSHLLARNDEILDSSLRLRFAQNDNMVADSANLSPQDEFANSATCKNDIIGFWLSPRDKVSARTSIIEIFKKDGKYFAYNVAFLDELPPKKDALNQNFALRDREILGSVYAYNLERSGEASYINGRYYDFNRGKIFHLKAKLDCRELILLISADNVGFLGKKKIYKALEKSEAEFYIKTRPKIDFSGVK